MPGRRRLEIGNSFGNQAGQNRQRCPDPVSKEESDERRGVSQNPHVYMSIKNQKSEDVDQEKWDGQENAITGKNQKNQTGEIKIIKNQRGFADLGFEISDFIGVLEENCIVSLKSVFNYFLGLMHSENILCGGNFLSRIGIAIQFFRSGAAHTVGFELVVPVPGGVDIDTIKRIPEFLVAANQERGKKN